MLRPTTALPISQWDCVGSSWRSRRVLSRCGKRDLVSLRLPWLRSFSRQYPTWRMLLALWIPCLASSTSTSPRLLRASAPMLFSCSTNRRKTLGLMMTRRKTKRRKKKTRRRVQLRFATPSKTCGEPFSPTAMQKARAHGPWLRTSPPPYLSWSNRPRRILQSRAKMELRLNRRTEWTW